MNNKNNIDYLENLVREFCEVRNWSQYHKPKDLAIGISTEANELLEIFRFKSDEDVKEIMKNHKKIENVENELADILFFLLRFSQMNDIDLKSVLERKLEINEKKYPQELSKGSNKKYNEL